MSTTPYTNADEKFLMDFLVWEKAYPDFPYGDWRGLTSAIESTLAKVAQLERELAEARAELLIHKNNYDVAVDSEAEALAKLATTAKERDTLRARVAELELQVAERDNYKRSVENAHAALDACALIRPRHVTHQGLTPRVKSLVARVAELEKLLPSRP